MKYRKKPVVVEAFKWTGGHDQEDDPVWIKEAIEHGKVKFVNGFLKGNSFFGATNGPDIVMEIETLEGKMLVAQGDYIIRGVRGEIYPCKPDIFEETYDVVGEDVVLVYKHGAPGDTSDGSHTFDELYYHRMMLFAFICNSHKADAWKSLQHDDGTMYDDYFIVGIDTPEGQFTYHYHIDHWDKFDVMMIDKAPKWDGHTSDDITRLNSLLSRS